jgi:DNA-binding MarR family transcriptional regulator
MFDPVNLKTSASSAPGRARNSHEARLAVAKWLYWSRGLRPTTLAASMFGEPAWDLLLDLYIREKTGARSSVTSACIGSRVPHTTALRHIAAMSKAGWIVRIPDEGDKRRFWLALSPMAVKKLDGHFDNLAATANFSLAELETTA